MRAHIGTIRRGDVKVGDFIPGFGVVEKVVGDITVRDHTGAASSLITGHGIVTEDGQLLVSDPDGKFVGVKREVPEHVYVSGYQIERLSGLLEGKVQVSPPTGPVLEATQLAKALRELGFEG